MQLARRIRSALRLGCGEGKITRWQGYRALDKSSAPPIERQTHGIGTPPATPPIQRKRFGIVSALVRLALAVLVLGVVVFQTMAWVNQRPEAPQRMNRERTFTVEVVDPVYDTHSAPIVAYGQVAAARTIDVRTLVEGRVIETAQGFSSGNAVAQGDVLVTIDPFAYDGAVVEARANIANAELSLAEAQEAYRLEQSGIESARSALDAARTDLDRAQSLLSSGAATQQTVETRQLTVTERDQALAARESNLVTLNAEILRQRAAIEQARYALETAQRDRANTEITAPFAGVVTERNITTGAYVNANEVVASLYDTAALEVSFTVADSTYATLRRDGLLGRDITVSRTTGTDVSVPGTIARVAAQVDSTTGGITLYGALDEDSAEALRPGTFVAVDIEGIAHENTLRVPETAVYDENHLYVIRDGRMASVDVEILDRDNAHLIVRAEVPEGERIITNRLSQAGDGVAVEVEGEEVDEPGRSGPGGGPGRPGR